MIFSLRMARVINAKDFSSLQKNRYSQGVGGNSRFFCRPVWPHTPYLSFLPCLAAMVPVVTRIINQSTNPWNTGENVDAHNCWNTLPRRVAGVLDSLLFPIAYRQHIIFPTKAIVAEGL